MELTLNMPDGPERLKAEPAGEHYRLLQHAFAPLVPGDIVSAEGGVITGVVKTAKVFTVLVFFRRSVSPARVAEKFELWSRAAYADREDLMVTSVSREWLMENVEEDPDVDCVDIIRVPGHNVTLAEIQGYEP